MMSASHQQFRMKVGGSLILAVAVVTLMRVSLVNWFLSLARPLRISAGSGEGKRHEIAKTLVSVSRHRGLSIDDPVPTTGSVQVIKQVAEGTLDLGLVQGGLLKYLENSLKDQELRS